MHSRGFIGDVRNHPEKKKKRNNKNKDEKKTLKKKWINFHKINQLYLFPR